MDKNTVFSIKRIPDMLLLEGIDINDVINNENYNYNLMFINQCPDNNLLSVVKVYKKLPNHRFQLLYTKTIFTNMINLLKKDILADYEYNGNKVISSLEAIQMVVLENFDKLNKYSIETKDTKLNEMFSSRFIDILKRYSDLRKEKNMNRNNNDCFVSSLNIDDKKLCYSAEADNKYMKEFEVTCTLSDNIETMNNTISEVKDLLISVEEFELKHTDILSKLFNKKDKLYSKINDDSVVISSLEKSICFHKVVKNKLLSTYTYGFEYIENKKNKKIYRISDVEEFEKFVESLPLLDSFRYEQVKFFGKKCKFKYNIGDEIYILYSEKCENPLRLISEDLVSILTEEQKMQYIKLKCANYIRKVIVSGCTFNIKKIQDEKTSLGEVYTYAPKYNVEFDNGEIRVMFESNMYDSSDDAFDALVKSNAI